MNLGIAVSTANKELVIERVFNAPQKLTFEAFTKPEHITRWWGPHEFTLPHCEMDFRVGGAYKCCMLSPTGEEHWVWGTYEDINEYDRIVFTWDRKDLEGNPRSKSVVRLTFEDMDGKTKLTLRQGKFEHQWDCDEHSVGWTQSLERMEEFLRSE